MNPLAGANPGGVRRGELHPTGADDVLGMRIMAYLGSLVFLVSRSARSSTAAVRSRRSRGCSGSASARSRSRTSPPSRAGCSPRWAASPGSCSGLLKTGDANSPSVSSTTIAFSLGTFGLLYAALAVVDVILMRRYARLDPPEVGGDGDEFALPAATY